MGNGVQRSSWFEGREMRRNDSWGLPPFQPDVRIHEGIYNLLLIAFGCYSFVNPFHIRDRPFSKFFLIDNVISLIIIAKLEITQIFKSQGLVKYIITYPHNRCMQHLKMFHNSIFIDLKVGCNIFLHETNKI